MNNNINLRNGLSGRCERRSGNDFFLQPLGRVGEDRDLRLEQIRICISTGNIEKLSYCTFSRAIWFRIIGLRSDGVIVYLKVTVFTVACFILCLYL